MENRAAWITEAKAKPFKVDAAPYPTAGPGEIIVKNFAVALVRYNQLHFWGGY